MSKFLNANPDLLATTQDEENRIVLEDKEQDKEDRKYRELAAIANYLAQDRYDI